MGDVVSALLARFPLRNILYRHQKFIGVSGRGHANVMLPLIKQFLNLVQERRIRCNEEHLVSIRPDEILHCLDFVETNVVGNQYGVVDTSYLKLSKQSKNVFAEEVALNGRSWTWNRKRPWFGIVAAQE